MKWASDLAIGNVLEALLLPGRLLPEPLAQSPNLKVNVTSERRPNPPRLLSDLDGGGAVDGGEDLGRDGVECGGEGGLSLAHLLLAQGSHLAAMEVIPLPLPTSCEEGRVGNLKVRSKTKK